MQLGGLHSNAYISDLFAREYAKTGMKAYVELVQRKEREIGTDVLTHQKVGSICTVLFLTTDIFHSGPAPTTPTTS